MALPAARLQGLYLALMSVAFAQVMALVFFPHPWVFPPIGSGRLFPHIDLFGTSLDNRRSFFVFLVCVFAVIVFVLVVFTQLPLWASLDGS